MFDQNLTNLVIYQGSFFTFVNKTTAPNESKKPAALVNKDWTLWQKQL